MEGETSYLGLLQEILENGDYRQTRNGGTYSLFGKNIRFNLKNQFPLLTTKRVFFRGVIEELLFFLRGETNSKKLEEKNINIWKLNITSSFIQSRNLPYEEGDMGPMYGFNWLHYGAQYRGMNENYENEGMNQIDQVLHLLKHDPFNRRIIMTTYNPLCAEEGVLYPCHGIVTQFYVKEKEGKKYVSCLTYLRSNDMFLGSPFNIASYAALTYLFCKILNDDETQNVEEEYIPDELIMNIGDCHIYEEHKEACMEQISRIPFEFPKLQILHKKHYKDYVYEDFELIDYQCHSTIKAVMKA